MRRLRSGTLAVVIAAIVAACSSSSPTAPGGAGGGATAPAADGGAGGGGATSGSAPGASTSASVSGSLAMTGAYEATWAWAPGNAVDPGDITLTSDKGTFASITVKPDGTLTMRSGQVSEIGLGATGKAASVGVGVYAAVCTFTVDADLAGAPGGAIHLKGAMTIKGDVFGNCP